MELLNIIAARKIPADSELNSGLKTSRGKENSFGALVFENMSAIDMNADENGACIISEDIKAYSIKYNCAAVSIAIVGREKATSLFNIQSTDKQFQVFISEIVPDVSNPNLCRLYISKDIRDFIKDNGPVNIVINTFSQILSEKRE